MSIKEFFQKNWITLVICLFFSITTLLIHLKTSNHNLEISGDMTEELPPSLKVYYYLNYYADSLDLPINYLYGVANTESSWQGPLDFRYKPNLKSPVGALGPMQVMPLTAKMVIGKSIEKSQLQNNIQLNIKISAILIKQLYDKYRDWKIVFGCYNTGKPKINNYAIKVYNFKPKWSDSLIINLKK